MLAYIQLCLLLLLIGYYTPAFFKEYADLTFFCGGDMCNGDPEDDFLPESLPWISRLYVALLLLAIASAVGCFAPPRLVRVAALRALHRLCRLVYKPGSLYLHVV
ncbi:hypothetical protein ACMSEC_18715 [Bacteroides faecis]|jgi:hypothetical protein|nr:hypothetical protein HMPREF2794_18880 [Bacteroides sp. HMSC067B03]